MGLLPGGAAPATWKMCDNATSLWSLQMEKDSSRAEQRLHQSLQYLRDPQECVQDWTIRFMSPSPGSLFGQPLSPPAPAQCHIQAAGGPWLFGIVLGNSRG